MSRSDRQLRGAPQCFGFYDAHEAEERACYACLQAINCIGMTSSTSRPAIEASKVEEMASANKQANEQPIKKRAPDFLQAALGHMQDRAATYDKPEGERSMGAAVAAFNAATGHALTETQGWLFMVFLKAIRSQQGAFRADNFEDMAAYAGLAGESAIRARELEQ